MTDEAGAIWTRLLACAKVTKQPQPAVVGGVKLAVWRAARGRPVVFVDRCPHRQLPLSNGRRTLLGRLVCDGHGWEFDATGTCRRAPGRPLAETAGRRASVVVSREADGWLWVLTDAEGVPVLLAGTQR